MRILFIAPPFQNIYSSFKYLYRKSFSNPPISLCYLASAVINAGHEAKIVDCEAEQLDIKKTLEIVKNYKPGLIGLTATSVDFCTALKYITHFKSELPEIPIILGGTHMNIFDKSILEENREIDFGCIGDGEDLIVELLEQLAANNKDMRKIDGLIYRYNNDVKKNKNRLIETNIDRYTFPARHLLMNELYYRDVPHRGYRITASMMSSRGCPYSCIYCAVKNIPGANVVRSRSAENVVEEMVQIVRCMGIKHFAFNDDCLTLKKDRVYKICELIRKNGLKVTWEGLSRADLIDKEMLIEMKKTGFVRISYGIESGSPEMLKIIQKNETLEQIKQAFKITKEVGIVARGSIILGSPYETNKTIKETMRFIKKLKGLDQVVINILQPYPGTKVREMILNEEGGSKFVGEQTDYNNLNRFGKASISVNDLLPHDLVRYQKKGFFMFYSRPKIIWNNLRILGLKAFLISSFNFVRSLVNL